MTVLPPARDWTVRPGLSGRVWRAGRPRAALLLQHGYGEYAERYVAHHAGLIPALVAAGIDVFAFDMTGHGGSAGRRGVTDVAAAVADHRAARRLVAAEAKGLPLFLLGHSLGGLVTAASVAEDQAGLAGVILSAPALLMPATPGLRAVAWGIAAVAPSIGLAAPQGVEGLSRVAAAVDAYVRDPRIVRRRLPARVAASALATAHRAWPRFRDWAVPAAVIHGTADTYTDPRGSDLFAAMVRADCRLVRVEDGRHELLNDLGGAALRDELIDWIVARLPPPVAARPATVAGEGGPGSLAFAAAVAAVRDGGSARDQARALHARLTEAERLALLDGDLPFFDGVRHMMTERYNVRPYVLGAVERLGIPGIRFVDGPRGCASGNGTAFPVTMARGATWDAALEEEVGDVIGREVRAMGGNFYGGVCINLLRHPAWGRAQETYGDEPCHLGTMGAALHRGAQRHVMTCVKHYVVNSMENARFQVDVRISEADLHDMYLPHFRQVVDAGVDAVMSSYNAINGEWAGQHPYMLTDVLRTQWRFDGMTISDFVLGLRDSAKSLEAGLDLEAPYAQQRRRRLRRQIAAGDTGWDKVDRAGVRILTQQLRSYAARRPEDPSRAIMADDAARALARRVAARAMVLLKNEPVGPRPVLPIVPGTVRRIALVGRLTEADNLGDHGSSRVVPPGFVTPAEGLRARYPDAEIIVVTDDSPEAAARAAAQADVAIVVAGYDWQDEGEYVGGAGTLMSPKFLPYYGPPPPSILLQVGRTLLSGTSDRISRGGKGGDRHVLTLRAVDEAIIRAVAAANPRTVTAIVAAGAVVTENWRAEVPAMLMMWYAGMEGGHALADIVSGAANPSGRLPYAIPRSPDDLPAFDADATTAVYDRLHGQRLIDARGATAAFPYGFGLSYTSFAIVDAVEHRAAGQDFSVAATIRNTGDRSGHHVVQVYGCRTIAPYRGQTMLLGFAVVEVAAGAAASIVIPCSLLPLAAWCGRTRWRRVPGRSEARLFVGAHARDEQAWPLDDPEALPSDGVDRGGGGSP